MNGELDVWVGFYVWAPARIFLRTVVRQHNGIYDAVMKQVRLFVCLLLVSGLLPLYAQFPGFPQPQGERIDADAALDRALKMSSLPGGGRPFHAVMEIGAAGSPYSGRVEVWWAEPKKYKSVITSSAFSQTRVVNGDRVMEANTGDYYPRWLQNFVDGLLNPIPMIKNFKGRGEAVIAGPSIMNSCLRRDDRPGGITDEMTWGMVCFAGSEPRLESVLTMNYDISFENWKGFGKQKIARTYKTSVLDFKEIVGQLTTLEELRNAPDDLFAVTNPTPAAGQIKTAFVSTLKEESLLEKAPTIEWPTVREGKTEGYMIVYARTDRTGQVRETAKHNSDQPGLESFGMEQALRYKFKPLLVNGEAVQMEMPLVLHFATKIGDPIPELNDSQTRKIITGCSLPREISDPASSGQQIVIQFQVQDDGGLMTLGASDRKIPIPVLYQQFRGCHFGIYKQNGVATAYHANLTVTAR
jgi:hypothetical protein